MKKIFFTITAFLLAVLGVTAVDNEFKNILINIDVDKTGDNAYKIDLLTQVPYSDEIKLVKKSDYNYYILLAETYSKPISKKISNDINPLEIQLFPYVEQGLNNGYTKITLNTARPLDLTISLKAKAASKYPIMDVIKLAKLDQIYLEKNNTIKTGGKILVASAAPTSSAKPATIPAQTPAAKTPSKPVTTTSTPSKPVIIATTPSKPVIAAPIKIPTVVTTPSKPVTVIPSAKPAIVANATQVMQPSIVQPVNPKPLPRVEQTTEQTRIISVPKTQIQEPMQQETPQEPTVLARKAQQKTTKPVIARTKVQQEPRPVVAYKKPRKEFVPQPRPSTLEQPIVAPKKQQPVVATKPQPVKQLAELEPTVQEPLANLPEIPQTEQLSPMQKLIKTAQENPVLPITLVLGTIALLIISSLQARNKKIITAQAAQVKKKTAETKQPAPAAKKMPETKQGPASVAPTYEQSPTPVVYPAPAAPPYSFEPAFEPEKTAAPVYDEPIVAEQTQHTDAKEENTEELFTPQTAQSELVETVELTQEDDVFDLSEIEIEELPIEELQEELVDTTPQTVEEEFTQEVVNQFAPQFIQQTEEDQIEETAVVEPEEQLAEETIEVAEEIEEPVAQPMVLSFNEPQEQSQIRQQKPRTPTRKNAVATSPQISDRADILSKVRVEKDRGFYLADYKGVKSLVAYVMDNIFVIHSFKNGIKDPKIDFRLSESTHDGDFYLVKVDNSTMLVKSQNQEMSLAGIVKPR